MVNLQPFATPDKKRGVANGFSILIYNSKNEQGRHYF